MKSELYKEGKRMGYIKFGGQERAAVGGLKNR